MANDTELHFRELLLTLQYLLNYTDEEHPAKQLDICRYAREYGLKFDPNSNSGNDIKRQRIAKCLEYLEYVTYRFADKAPFVLKTTKGGKYYIEEKNHLDEEQIIKVLAAVKNDKYTQDEDTDLLIERLLDSLSNEHNREHLRDEVDKASRNVKKYDLNTNRKIRLVNKAYNEGKLLKIRWKIYNSQGTDVDVYDFWYRVYKIKEFKNKPYAILLPVSTGDILFYQSLLFDSIENLIIPRESDKDVLMEDPEPKRNLNDLFAKFNKSDYRFYGDIDKMMEANIMPQGGYACKVSFYFRLGVAKYVVRSFEEYFSIKLNFTPCAAFDILDEKDVPIMNDKRQFNDHIIAHPLKEGEKPLFGVANILINKRAFQSWMLSDPHGEGMADIAGMINVVYPDEINKHMAYFYSQQLLKFKKYLTSSSKEDFLSKLNTENPS